MKVIIEACQFAEKGELIYVTVDGVKVGLPCETKATRTASYDTVFYSKDFNPDYHGFTGIMNGLKVLCNYQGIIVSEVDIETVSQLQHDLLVKAGMEIDNELIASDGINVTFRVTSDVAEKYNSLLEFAISEWTLIIAQSE